MKKRRLIYILVIALAVYFIATNFYQNDDLDEEFEEEIMSKMEITPKYKKVLLIGIDGMDPKITKALMHNGKLPNFKKLSENGTFVNLKTSNPPHSPVAWTSIATGTNPGKHNIFDFIRRNPENYMPELSLNKPTVGFAHFGTEYESYVKATPFWRSTSKAGIPTTVIRWPVTFPPEDIEGNLLAGLGVPDIKGFLSGYTYYTNKEINDKNSPEKIVRVNINDESIINTEISGPKTKKSGDIVNVKAPLKITLFSDHVELTINDNKKPKYQVKEKEWSDWIRVEFKVGLFKTVHGTCKFYLNSLDPFELYLTTIQIDPEKPVVPISAPKSYSSDLAKEIGLFFTLGMPEETDGYVDERIDTPAFLAQVAQIEDERNKMFWKEFNEFKDKDKGILAFVYDSSDRVQHVFWNEKVLGEDDGIVSLKQAVVDYYVEKDKFIGEVMKELEDSNEDTLLLIISDHGFNSFERAVSMNSWLVKNGFMTLTQELEEGEEGALFRYVDWSKTKAYSLGFNSLYINVQGREAKGIVNDLGEDSERNKVVEEIIEKLESFTDPLTDKKVVNKVYKREDIYSGEYIKDAPDIIIGFNPGYRMSWQTAIGGFTEEIIINNTKKWKGDHLIDPKFVPGVLFSNVNLNVGEADQKDIAATILDAFGLDLPEEIDGKSLVKE